MSNSQQQIRIAVDAMGGDYGPSVTIPATIQFLQARKHPEGVHVCLVGRQEGIEAELKLHNAMHLLQENQLSIEAASQIVAMDEHPAVAVKKKKDSSMRVAINRVKSGDADACVSAGNTGALMATARFVLKTISGVKRPAICSTIPCKDQRNTVHMLDLGANVDSQPNTLLQFAIMGSVLTETIDGKKNPRVGLLNVGTEEIKGSDKVKQASALLTSSKLNYIGYIESNEIYSSKVDVIVCDGFEGNVALKASEGTAGLISHVLRDEFRRNIFTRIAGLICYPVIKAMQSRLDPRRHNGATLIGLNGIVVKSHGGTDVLGFAYAIEEAFLEARRDIIDHISSEVERHLSPTD